MGDNGDNVKKLSSKLGHLSIPGTKPNVQNAQLLISTGIPSFDNIIGGGLAIGTILLIEEDEYGKYGKVMMKYFMAEGVVNGHSLFLGSKDVKSANLIKDLPAPITDVVEVERSSETSDDKLRIAWRYQNYPRVQETQKLRFGHNFDLSKTMDPTLMENVNVNYWEPKENIKAPNTFSNPAYHDLLESINNYIKSQQFDVNAAVDRRNVLRLVLFGLGSPYWYAYNRNTSSMGEDRDLDMFLYCLRSLMRSAYAVAMVTVPSYLVHEESISRCIHSVDTSVKIKSFVGTKYEDDPTFSGYSGIFHITKLPAINTMSSVVPETLDLAFKLRRKKFVIEKLHLPPELQESKQREQDENPTLGCSSTNRRNLDF